MRTLKCTDCGASFPIQDDNREFIFCEYCGTKLIYDVQHNTHHTGDEVKIKQIEADKAVKLKQLELLEKHQMERKRIKKIKVKISFGLAFVGLFFFLVGIFLHLGFEKKILLITIGLIAFFAIIFVWGPEINSDKDSNTDLLLLTGKIKVPNEIAGYKSMDYHAILNYFSGAGFVNIRVIPLYDVHLGIFKRVNGVEMILINGEMVIFGGGLYPPSAKIEIYYHSRRPKY